MIDFELGWRAVPGMFSTVDGAVLQGFVKQLLAGQATVETGAWCGRSLAAACEVLPAGVLAFSYDNYLEDSQANECSPITPGVAKALRQTVEHHYWKRGVDVRCEVKEASAAGKEYGGPPIGVLFIDDHHSAEQLRANFDAWLPRLAPRAVVLMHDYGHPPFRLVETAKAALPALGFQFAGQFGGLGVWHRGEWTWG
jgi:hypothetical protein